MMNEDISIMLEEYLDFVNAVKKNRSFPECKLITEFENDIAQSVVVLPRNTKMYRGRVFLDPYMNRIRRMQEKCQKLKGKKLVEQNEKIAELTKELADQHKEGFKGYNKEDSFVPTNAITVKRGRCNHDFEICLYATKDVDTAISELKPLIDEKISVAKLINHEDLNLVDLSFSNSRINKYILKAFLDSPIEEQKDAYIYTNVICDVVKKCGYDGIIYSSCQNRANYNYAIFNYDCCEVVSSDVYKVESIAIRNKIDI